MLTGCTVGIMLAPEGAARGRGGGGWRTKRICSRSSSRCTASGAAGLRTGKGYEQQGELALPSNLPAGRMRWRWAWRGARGSMRVGRG